MDEPVAIGEDVHHLAVEQAVPKGEAAALLGPLARACQGLPHVAALVLQQEELHVGAGPLLYAVDAGGQHPGIVEHQAVRGGEVVDNIVKVPVLNGPGSLVQHHQREWSRGSMGVWAMSSSGRSS